MSTTALLVEIAVCVTLMATETVAFAVQRFLRWRRDRAEFRAAAEQLRVAMAARRAQGLDDEGLDPIL